ncbi:MAG: efflux RND transporter periplasmic adaptor subunit [Akkermansia sp.]|nr:efflux RND transporter periplasmic adaptor subunit [Akkermansia sp.]
MKLRVLTSVLLLAGSALAQMPGTPATRVQVEKATTGLDMIFRRSIGHVEAIRKVQVRSAVEGFLMEAKFKEGSIVQEGDVLFEINPIRYKAAFAQAQATLKEINARIIYAENNYKRLKALASSHAASVENVESALARLEGLKAQKIEAEANLVKAEKDLNDCTIRAEITGRIGRREFSKGNYITQGEMLATITQTDPIYVRFPLSQSDVNGIFRGPKEISNVANVKLTTADGRGYPDAGHIEIVDNLLTGNTDTYTLWAKFDNKKQVLTPRGIGALHISLTNTAEVTMVPLTAVHHDEVGAYVYTVDNEGKVARREVISGTVQGRMQSIYDGLQPGETVITDGSHKTRVGATVMPVYPEEQKLATKPGRASTQNEEATVVAEIAEASPISDPTVLVCQGARVEAINRVNIRPLVQGVLEEPAFKEGDRVKQGDVLFNIDPTRYKATVDAQKAKIMQLDVLIADATSKYERQQQLIARNATSKDDVESAKATLDELQAQKEKAQAVLAVAEDDLSRCTVRAAIDSRIGRVNFSKGNYITDIKSPLATLVQLSPIYVRFSLSESSILSHFGNVEDLIRDAEITLVTANGKTFSEKGCVSFCDNVIQQATDTQNLWAIFNNAERELHPGGVVTIRVKRKADITVPGIPAQAVQVDTRGKYVYLLKNGRAVQTRIHCGTADENGMVPVFAGLENGAKVITTQLAELENGTPVQAK